MNIGNFRHTSTNFDLIVLTRRSDSKQTIGLYNLRLDPHFLLFSQDWSNPLSYLCLTLLPKIWLMAALSLSVHSATIFGLISFMYRIKAFRGFLMWGLEDILPLRPPRLWPPRPRPPCSRSRPRKLRPPCGPTFKQKNRKKIKTLNWLIFTKLYFTKNALGLRPELHNSANFFNFLC